MRYLLFFLCLSVQAQTRYDFTAVSQRVQHWVDRGYYPGAAMAVWKDGKPVYERSFGTYTPETEVYIASAGKWLAAATIAAVVDGGKLSWDDPVSRWLPEFTDVKGKATLRQLLSHTSGYPDYQPKGRHPDSYQTLAEAVAAIRPLPADTLPGTVFHYGGLAMQVAGRMAELASGKEWEALFQEKIARPLGMSHTHFTPVDPTPGHNPMVGGGARSCVRDYVRFLLLIQQQGVWEGKRVLSEKAIAALEADQVSPARVNPGEFVEEVRGNTHQGLYGLGVWREELYPDGRAIQLSSPGWAGAYPWIDRISGVVGVFFAHIDVSRPNPEGFSSFLGSPVLGTMVRRTVMNPEPTGRPLIPVRKGMAQAGDAQLYYEIAGNGPPVILLHGYVLDTRQWDRQFTELAKNYTVVRYDLRGYGQSDLPRKAFLHADDLGKLLDALNISRAHLVGSSLGAIVATDFAALHPERVLSLTVSGGGVSPDPGPDVPFSPEEKAKRQKEINEWREMRMPRTYLLAGLRMNSMRPDENSPLFIAVARDWSAWAFLHIGPRCLLGSSVIPKLPALRMPVLVLHGEQEPTAAAKASQALLDRVPRGRKVTLKSADLFANLDQPEAFTKALLAFLQAGK